MLRKSVLRQVYRFCSKDKVQQRQSSFLTQAEKQFENIPLHERPYDKEKYEVPMKKIKRNSGYALLQVQPFPRGRIMKICYHILHQIKIGIPEDSTFRILTEEKTKYIMELVDKEEDVQQLQRIVGCERIQIFISGLARQLQYIKAFREMKPWLISDKQKGQVEADFVDNFKLQEEQKFPAYKRPERPVQKII